MALFGLFGKKKPSPAQADWPSVAGRVAGLLWHLIRSEPKTLAGQYARIVLRDDWNVGLAADKRDPEKILGPHEVCFVFLQEDRASLAHWIDELQKNPIPMFQQIATEEYAKKLVRVLKANVEVVD